MKIHSVRLENFRSFRDETVLLDEYTCLVGPNGAGKSTVLCALNIFFRESENAATDVVNLSSEDFHKKDTSVPIRITVTFSELNDQAKEDFKEYFRQDRLIVTAVAQFNAASGRAEVKQFGQRMGITAFRPFFEAATNGAKVADLKTLYSDLRGTYVTLPAAGTRDAMIDALHDFETSNASQCEPIPSEDQFYGFSRGSNRLAKYVQWVYIPAVKDVTVEQTEGKTTALGKLLARTVRLKLKFDDIINELRQRTEADYQRILDDNQGALKELQDALSEKLTIWAHPNASVKLSWQKDSKSAIAIQQPNARTTAGEGAFEGDLARLGHGFQRSYLLAVLQVLAATGDERAPTLILGVEEPELYQHPPQIRHLASVFEQLSQDSSQIVVSTHNPSFVTGKGFEAVRMVRYSPSASASSCKALLFDDYAKAYAAARGEAPLKEAGVAAVLQQALQSGLSEIFFAKNLVLVEGLEDLAFITSWMVLTGRWNECRKRGIHIVPANGKSQMIRPLILAKAFEIPTFVVFDADGGDLDKDGRRKGAHKKDNEALLAILDAHAPDPFPADTVWSDRFTVWPSNMTEIVCAEIPPGKFSGYEDKARATCGFAPSMQKNSVYIGELLRLAHEDKAIPGSLEMLCEAILNAST